jgi:hypothetical protein
MDTEIHENLRPERLDEDEHEWDMPPPECRWKFGGKLEQGSKQIIIGVYW